MHRHPAPLELPAAAAHSARAGWKFRPSTPAWRALGVAFVQALTLSACAAGAGPYRGAAESVTSPASSAQTLAALRAAVGDAPCTRNAQCHSVGVGQRPCGGPEGYLAWSEQTAEAVHIAALAARHAAARKAENERSGIASDCRFRPDPGATCRPRAADSLASCQLGTGGRAGAV